MKTREMNDRNKEEMDRKEEAESQEVEESAQLYDQIFWTEINQLTRYVPALVNEAFGTHYTPKAKIILKSGKQVTERPLVGFTRRDVDALINMEEFNEEQDYHFECEVLGRNSIALRIVQYAAGYAAQSATITEEGAVLRIPYSAVIFLRSTSTNITERTIRIVYPGGSGSYKVPVLKIRDYTINELFQKELYLLIPFAVFKFSEEEYARMDETDIHQLRALIEDIGSRLNGLVEEGKIEPWERGNLLRYMNNVLLKLTKKFKNVAKEAEEVMGGFILKTDIDIAMEEGQKEGWLNGQLDYLKQLVREGVITKENAEFREQEIRKNAMAMAEQAVEYTLDR